MPVLKSFRLTACAALCTIGVGVIPLASAQSLWQYSAQGSFVSTQNSILNVSGPILIDGQVRAWHSPNLPSLFPTNSQSAFLIPEFDLHIGNLSFYGGGPFSNPGNVNALYIPIIDPSPGTIISAAEWFLTGSGDFIRWSGDAKFFNSDGTRASVGDIFQAPPAIIQMNGSAYCSDLLLCGHIQLNWTQVAPIPEPEIYAMMGVGLAFLSWVGRRKTLKERAAV